MISFGRNEILLRFAGIPAVLKTLHKLSNTCEKLHPGKAESLVCIAGTKFSHHLSEMKTLINTSV